MTGASLSAQTRILAFSVAVEIATGIASIVAPAVVIGLLLGTSDFGQLLPMARCFGVALLGLGLACWPSRFDAANASSALRGMLTYNALIALFLAWFGAVEHIGGILLWPAVALHAVVALALVGSRLVVTGSRATL